MAPTGRALGAWRVLLFACAILLATIPGRSAGGQAGQGKGRAGLGAEDLVGSLISGEWDGARAAAWVAANGLLRAGDRLSALRAVLICTRLPPAPGNPAVPPEVSLTVGQMLCGEGAAWDGANRLRALIARGGDGGGGELLAAASAALGMCLMQSRAFRGARDAFAASLALNPEQEGVAWHMGLACDYGEDWEGAIRAYTTWMGILRSKSAPAPHVPRPKGVTVVSFFCLFKLGNDAGGRWGPSSIDGKGIGGSEEALILLARQLAKRGLHVEVFGHPEDHDIGTDEHGVVWLPVYACDKSDPPDIFVSWRGYALGSLPGNRSLNFLWLHDKVQPKLLPPPLVEELQGIFVLSRHHMKQLPRHAKSKAILTNNGLDEGYLVEGPNDKNVFVFASHPERGLEEILLAWGGIRTQIPNAQLKIYHGFPAGYGQAGAPQSELQRMKAFKVRVDDLLQRAQGVEHHGMVDHKTLARAYASAGFWLYPISMAETSCISAMKAMAMGAIPITSRFRDSGLVETCGDFDLGPFLDPSSTVQQSHLHLQEWAKAVVAAYHNETLDSHRRRMVKWARERFTWAAVRSTSMAWLDLFAVVGDARAVRLLVACWSPAYLNDHLPASFIRHRLCDDQFVSF